MSGAALRLRGIGKSFFGVPVLSDVSLDIVGGRVLGLVGQNGAGKSTLMNIIGGNLLADTGRIEVDGATYAPGTARDAERSGIGFIHQELNLFSNLTIAENIFIAQMPRSAVGLIDRGKLNAVTTSLLREVELDVPANTLVDRLSPGERQLVEVLKALQLDARIIIFDEPTTSLTPRETTRLFGLIDKMRTAGKAVVYISHILADVEAIADDVAVLRDGRLMATGPTEEFPASRMINLMLGRDIEQLYPPHVAATEKPVLLAARGLSAPGAIKNVTLTLHRGEILGIFGLMGSGRTELARMLFGLDHFHAGELEIAGTKVSDMSPRKAIRARMAFITENRREEGLMMNMSIAENLVLASLDALGNGAGVIDQARLMASAVEFAAALQIKSGPIASQQVRSLSGGNQQKVVIAKWLMSAPAIFLLDEPTRGVDVSAKFEIHSIINRLAASGSGLILISSEIEETMAMADRVMVMRAGEVTGEFVRAGFTKEAILHAAFGEANAA